MPTTSPAETGLKWRWWQELKANPPTWPIWKESHGLMFAVVMALQGHAHADGTSIFPSAETVGSLIGASRKSVEKYRKALVLLNMIELVSQGKGTGDASVYRLRDPSEWLTVEDGFDAAMAAVPEPAMPKPETPAASPEPERVRAALQGAPNRKALVQVRDQWACVIEPDAGLRALYCTLAMEFKRNEKW